MRDALRESLEKQWKTEQEKKQQMSALAHDIKTPLTIVRGNAELLSETELTTEQKNNITLCFERQHDTKLCETVDRCRKIMELQ